MLSLIINKELRDIIGSAKFAITFGICSLLIVLSFIVGITNYHVAREQFTAANTANLRQYDAVTDWMNVQSFKISLPPQPLAMLVNGVSNDIGRNIEVRGRGELTAEDSVYGDDPIFAMFRFLDLEFIFAIVLSLFAILFGYDAINGEKERGTLRLTFANAVPRATYIMGKFIGSYLALAVPLLIPISFGVLLLPLFGIALTGEEWMKLLLVIVAGFVCIGSYLFLSLFVSSKTERSSTSFLVLLTLWIFSVMIVPRISVTAANLFVTVPSLDEINSQKSRFMSQIWSEDKKKMADYKPEKTDDMQKLMDGFNKYMQTLADDREQRYNELAFRLNEERANAERVQRRLSFIAASVSPSALFSLAVSEIAGTSLRLREQYAEQAREYQKEYAKFMKEKTGVNTGGFSMVFRMRDDSNTEKPKPINIRELLEFRFSPVGLQQSGGNYALYTGLLALFGVAFFAGAFLSFRQYDVR